MDSIRIIIYCILTILSSWLLLKDVNARNYNQYTIIRGVGQDSMYYRQHQDMRQNYLRNENIKNRNRFEYETNKRQERTERKLDQYQYKFHN